MFLSLKATRDFRCRPRAAMRLLCAALTLLMAAGLLLAAPAEAAKVSGTLTASSGYPEVDRQVHFEDRVSRDIFLAPTNAEGNFSVSLPPGTYDLRAETGAVIASNIKVGDADIALGKVSEPARFNLMRLFQLQGLLEGVATTPAPSTANLPEGGEAPNSTAGAEASTAAEPTSTATPSAAAAK